MTNYSFCRFFLPDSKRGSKLPLLSEQLRQSAFCFFDQRSKCGFIEYSDIS